MNTRFRNFWESINSTFWFIPALMTLMAGGISFVLIALDETYSDELASFFGYNRGPQGAQSLLSTIASSVITVAGVTFSITIAALTLASNQFGPRLLRNFMRNRGNQMVLGTFISTFLYCLLVLRTINGNQEYAFVPHLSVTFGVVLAIANLGVLIYFIHHTATQIQAENIISLVSEELHYSIDHLFPEKLQQTSEKYDVAKDLPPDFENNSCEIKANDEGYLQVVDTDLLLELTTQHQLVCRLPHRPGEFIFKGMVLVEIWPERKVDEALKDAMSKGFVLGSARSSTQDVLFVINQLVEVALRALSPGINDPFTAINCIDRLGAALNHLGERRLPSPYHYQDGKILRVIARPVTITEIVEQVFAQLREVSVSHFRVLLHLIEIISQVITNTRNRELRLALFGQATLLERAGVRNLEEEADREKITGCYRLIQELLIQI